MRVFNQQVASSYDPAATSVVAGTPMTQPIRHMLMPNHLEAGYKPYPFSRIASIVAAPAVIQTAAVGVNPWDQAYGPVGQRYGNPVPALRIGPQTSNTGF